MSHWFPGTRSTSLRRTFGEIESNLERLLHIDIRLPQPRLRTAAISKVRPFLSINLLLLTAVLALASWQTCRAAELPEELLSGLADPDFKARESAELDLLQWARKHEEEAPSLIYKEYYTSKDPEVRSRCMSLLESLARDSYATHGKGFIGIRMDDVMAEVPGEEDPVPAVIITKVIEGMAAEKAGLREGELVIGINGKRWPAPATDAMRDQVMDLKPMTKVQVQVLREDQIEDVEVTLVRRPLRADNLMLERMPERAAAAEQAQWEKFLNEWKQQHDPKQNEPKA